jgi:hypothetical protein
MARPRPGTAGHSYWPTAGRGPITSRKFGRLRLRPDESDKMSCTATYCNSPRVTVGVSSTVARYDIWSWYDMYVHTLEGPATHLCLVLSVCRGYVRKRDFAGPPWRKHRIRLSSDSIRVIGTRVLADGRLKVSRT